MKLKHVHHWTFDKLICAISIICLAVVLVLVLVLKDFLRTYFKPLSLSSSLGVRSLSLSLSLGVRSLLTPLGISPRLACRSPPRGRKVIGKRSRADLGFVDQHREVTKSPGSKEVNPAH